MDPSPIVLIVDDDTISRMLLQHMVRAQGYTVIEADSVDPALEILHSESVSLVICDYVMPDRDGLDLLEAMPDPSVPFVLLTGAFDEAQLADPRVEGVAAYLTKPVASDLLQQVVEDMLRNSSQSVS